MKPRTNNIIIMEEKKFFFIVSTNVNENIGCVGGMENIYRYETDHILVENNFL